MEATGASPGSGPARGTDRAPVERSRRGRRPGKPATREHIARTAHALFARDGFHETSLRAIAREAGVDPALVHHYFASKETLFFESMRVAIDPDRILRAMTGPGLAGVGRRLATFLVKVWGSPVGAQILRTVTEDPTALRLYASVVTQQMERAFDLLLPTRTHARTEALAQLQSVVSGLILTRYVLRLPAAVSLSDAETIRIYGDLIQSRADDLFPDEGSGERRANPAG